MSQNAANQNVLAVIMARAGSVGLPGKSIIDLLGRPVIAYTFDHVRASKLITRTVVSSDDSTVLKLATAANFETIQRPVELATSASATDPVLRHAVRTLYPQIENQQSKIENPAAVVMLYGNVPIRLGGMIDHCIEMLFKTGCDSVQTIAPVGKMHPYWMFDRTGDGHITKHIPNNIFRRQELPELFAPTGAVYVTRTDVLMVAESSTDPHAFLGTDRRGLDVQPQASVDIDNEIDLFLAEGVLRWHSEKLGRVLTRSPMEQFPESVRQRLKTPFHQLLSQQWTDFRRSRFDDSYIEFLDEQIKLEPRDPEWTALVKHRRNDLAAYVNQDLLRLSIQSGADRFSLYARSDTFETVHWELD